MSTVTSNGSAPIARRICKKYDAVCLEGGCGYCNLINSDAGWRKLTSLESELKKNKNLKHIGYYLNGKKHGFYKAQVKYEDGSLKYPEG